MPGRNVLAGPLHPVVTGMYAAGAKDRVRNIYLRGGRLALWVTLLVGLPAAIYAEPIIRLYVGPVYLEAAVVMVLTLAGLTLTSGGWMIWQVAAATGRVRAVSFFVLVTQVLIVAAVYYAVHILGWGATGVALSTFTAGSLLEALVFLPLGLKLAEATFSAWTRETLIPGLAPGCIGAVVWAALGLIVPPSTWTGLGLCTLAGALCYMAVLLGWCLAPQDKDDLRKLLTRVRSSMERRSRPPDLLSPLLTKEPSNEGRC